MKTVAFILLGTLALSNAAYAGCPIQKLDGEWSKIIHTDEGARENVGSFKEVVYSLKSDSLTVDVDLHDSSGIYYQKEFVYSALLDSANCIITSRGVSTRTKSRNFEEPGLLITGALMAGDKNRFFIVRSVSADGLNLSECENAECARTISELDFSRKAP